MKKLFKKKEVTHTEKVYSRYKWGHRGLWVSKYLLSVTPATIQVGVNWNEWFNGYSAPQIASGFASMLVSVIMSIYLITKKDKDFTDKFSPLFAVCLCLGMFGVSSLFLASLFSEFGYMLLYTCAGVLAGASADQVDKSIITPRRDEYASIMKEAGLNKNENKRLAKVEQAKKEKAELEERKRKAVD